MIIEYLSQNSIATAVLIASLSAFLLWKKDQNENQHDLNKLPGPQNMPIIGGSYEWLTLILTGRDHVYAEEFPKRYGPILKVNPIFNIFSVIFISDADQANRVLTDTRVFRKDDFLESKAVGLLDFSLFVLSTSEVHKRHRKLLQPAFAPSHLRQVSKASVKVIDELTELLESKQKGDKIIIDNSDQLMMDITLDVLGLVAFGKQFGSVAGVRDQKTQIWHDLDSFTVTPWAIRLGLPEFLWSFAGVANQSPGIREAQSKMKSFFKSFAAESKEKVKSYRSPLNKEEELAEERGKNQLNVLERLLLSLEQGKMSEKEVFGEVKLFVHLTLNGKMLGFFLAGHETSSHTLSCTLLEIAKNPDIQTRVYDEIKNVDLNHENLNDQLIHLKLLDNCVKEAQRLHTIVAAIPREVIASTDILGYRIPAGTKVMVSTRAIHLSPVYYDDPTAFKPDRWNSPPKNIHAFLPFGLGNHACIGMKMAIIEIKTVLICLLKRYTIKIDPSVLAKLDFTTRITFKPKNLSLIFEKRE